MKKPDSVLFAQTEEPSFPTSSRIDIIGQNGNDGLHYEPDSFAIQSLFSYGWDFIGFDDEDGLRETFTTENKAQSELDKIIDFTITDPAEWRIVPYNPHEDPDFARYRK